MNRTTVLGDVNNPKRLSIFIYILVCKNTFPGKVFSTLIRVNYIMFVHVVILAEKKNCRKTKLELEKMK